MTMFKYFLILLIFQLFNFSSCNILLRDSINILFEYSEINKNGSFRIYDFTNKNETTNFVIKDSDNFTVSYKSNNLINMLSFLEDNQDYLQNTNNYSDSFKIKNENYTEEDENFQVNNFSLKIALENNETEELLNFNLLKMTFKNFNANETKQDYFIEPDYYQHNNVNNFYLYPHFLLNNFSYSECANSLCENSKNQSDFNQHYFKIMIGNEIKEKYNIYLSQAKIVERKDDKIVYYKDLTQIIFQSETIPNLYSFYLEPMPDEFDLILIFTVRKFLNYDYGGSDDKVSINNLIYLGYLF